MLKKIHFFFIFFLLTTTIKAQQIVLSNNSKVSVLTCGRGEELYSTFGHTALRINDVSTGLDVVYNYGAFDFNTSNFYLKFVKGDLQYFMNVTSYREFIYEYEYYNREVIEQTLNLSQNQKQDLLNKLNENYISNEKFYTYKFIDKNCTTMVTDKINEQIIPFKIVKTDDKSISYRELLYPYFENYFWYKLGINIMFGLKTDNKSEQLFLPKELLNSLDNLTLKGNKIVQKKQTILEGKKIVSSFNFFNSIYFVWILLIGFLLTRNSFIYKSFLFISGILGLFLCLVGLYSQHNELLWNYNALLFNPLFLLLPFTTTFSKKVIKICLIILALYLLLLVNKPHFFIILPFIVTDGIMLYLLNKKLLSSVK